MQEGRTPIMLATDEEVDQCFYQYILVGSIMLPTCRTVQRIFGHILRYLDVAVDVSRHSSFDVCLPTEQCRRKVAA